MVIRVNGSVERGFRFLKDPWFMLDSIFLKKKSRIEALMMVMTLCLLVYNVGQYRFRQALKAKDESIPNQKGKPTQKPTMRWIFQCMEGISIIEKYEACRDKGKLLVKRLVTNITTVRRQIILTYGKSGGVLLWSCS